MLRVFLFLLVFSFVPAKGDCGRFSGPDPKVSPAFRSRYTNPTFGYLIRLPHHIVAYGEPPPQPAHGVGISLSREPRSYLYIDGSYNSGFAPDVATVAHDHEGYVRQDSLSVQRVTRTWARLGSRKALRLRMEHSCSLGSFVTDEIFLLKRDIIYTVSLTAPKTRYRQDKRVLEAIARSFEFTKPL